MAEQQQKAGSRTERLQDFFRQLPPKTLELLTSEFEKALARGGDDAAVAELVLGELRKVARICAHRKRRQPFLDFQIGYETRDNPLIGSFKLHRRRVGKPSAAILNGGSSTATSLDGRGLKTERKARS